MVVSAGQEVRAAVTVVSRSAGDTQALGERLGARLGPGDVVACVGELGAGKTCFLQGLARGLGVTGDVTSPTFVLINEYRGRLPVHHLDAYRVESLAEIVDLGVEELFHGDGVTLVEWADKLMPLLPAGAVLVRISGVGDEPREIALEGPPRVVEGFGS
jgi:tRNA threonylcarbamoyladenosine biosynthesis protein TsaE